MIPDSANAVLLAKHFGATTDYLLLEEYGNQENVISAINQNEVIVEQQTRLRKTVTGCFVALMGGLWMLMIWLPWMTGQVMIPVTEWQNRLPTWLWPLVTTIRYLGLRNNWLHFFLAAAAIIYGVVMIWRANRK